MTLQLEVGKTYVRRDGNAATVNGHSGIDSETYPFFVSVEMECGRFDQDWYTPNGRYQISREDFRDLIKEVSVAESDLQQVMQATSDGSTASYYKLPQGASELQDLISHRDMNAQIGEIFRACYRYGIASHSDRLRDAKKIRFYAEAEIKRLEQLK